MRKIYMLQKATDGFMAEIEKILTLGSKRTK